VFFTLKNFEKSCINSIFQRDIWATDLDSMRWKCNFFLEYKKGAPETAGWPRGRLDPHGHPGSPSAAVRS
jgi:hypothetical protein